MNNKLQQALENATKRLTGVMVTLPKDITIKYTLKGEECTERLVRGLKVDSAFKDKNFRNKWFQLQKILELVGD